MIEENRVVLVSIPVERDQPGESRLDVVRREGGEWPSSGLWFELEVNGETLSSCPVTLGELRDLSAAIGGLSV